MNRLQLLFLTSFFAFTQIAHGADLFSLKSCVEEGYQKIKNRPAIVAAVVDAKHIETMTFGFAKKNQIFEIGSITKTFTANLLSQIVESGEVSLSDPIPMEYQKPGDTITYENLVTHTSGIIEGIFPDFKVIHPLSPFDGLTIPLFKELYQKTPLSFKPGTDWVYSNIGVSLLGLILAEKRGASYETLVQKNILQVLGLKDTFFKVPASEEKRFPQGHLVDEKGEVVLVPHWNLYETAIDPAGGLRSTISDMAKYAQMNLAPQSSPLPEVIRKMQKKLYFIEKQKMWIGMSWIIQPEEDLIWHNGATYGFNSILAFSKKRQQAVVAMADATVLSKNEKGQVTVDPALQNIAFGCLRPAGLQTR